MCLLSKDFVGLNQRNSGQIMRLTSGHAVSVDPADEEEKLIIVITCWEGKY